MIARTESGTVTLAVTRQRSFIVVAHSHMDMPRAPHDVACRNADCELDMFEVHHTHEMPDDVGVDDYNCPYCGSDELEEIWPQ